MIIATLFSFSKSKIFLLKQLAVIKTRKLHFNPKEKIGISCDASEVGQRVVLFHRYADDTEPSIANASKTYRLTASLQPNTEGSFSSHLRNPEVPPLSVRSEIHTHHQPEASSNTPKFREQHASASW